MPTTGMTPPDGSVYELIEEPQHRLGRHIQHDPRSWAFMAPQATPASVTHVRHAPAWDQKNLGSCTGNAMAGALMTEPIWKPAWKLGEPDAVKLYSLATKLDPYPGSYPPNDTGSSGLAVMKAAVQMKYLKGYTHTFSLAQLLSALTLNPGITGINWYSSFDRPLATGECAIAGNAWVRGGHEVEMWRLDMEQQQIWCYQSWGPMWGPLHNGTFWFSFQTMTRLLSEKGDATFPVALAV